PPAGGLTCGAALPLLLLALALPRLAGSLLGLLRRVCGRVAGRGRGRLLAALPAAAAAASLSFGGVRGFPRRLSASGIVFAGGIVLLELSRLGYLDDVRDRSRVLVRCIVFPFPSEPGQRVLLLVLARASTRRSPQGRLGSCSGCRKPRSCDLI